MQSINKCISFDIIKILQVYVVTFFSVLFIGLKIYRSTIFFFFKGKNVCAQNIECVSEVLCARALPIGIGQVICPGPILKSFIFSHYVLWKAFLLTQMPNSTLELVTKCHSLQKLLFGFLKTNTVFNSFVVFRRLALAFLAFSLMVKRVSLSA